MKIQVIEATTQRPVANTKIQLQVKGKDSGFLSLTTDGTGTLTLDDKYTGQQIAATSGTGGAGTTGGTGGDGLGSGATGQVQFTTATEGARITVATTGAGAGTKQTETGGTNI